MNTICSLTIDVSLCGEGRRCSHVSIELVYLGVRLFSKQCPRELGRVKVVQSTLETAAAVMRKTIIIVVHINRETHMHSTNNQ